MSPVNTQKTEPQIAQPLTSFEKFKAEKEFNEIMKPLTDKGIDVSSAKSALVYYNSNHSWASPFVGDKEVASALRNAFQTKENQKDLQDIADNLAHIRQTVGMLKGSSGELEQGFKPSFQIDIPQIPTSGLMSNGENVHGDDTISYAQDLQVNAEFMKEYTKNISDGRYTSERYTPERSKKSKFVNEPSTVLQNELLEFDICSSVTRTLVDNLKEKDNLNSKTLKMAASAARSFTVTPELQLATYSMTDISNDLQAAYIEANPQAGNFTDARDREKLREKLIAQTSTTDLVKMLNENMAKINTPDSNYRRYNFDLTSFERNNPDVSEVAPGILHNKALNMHFPANAKELYQTEMQEELKEMFPNHNIAISFKEEVMEKDGKPVKFLTPVFSEIK